MLGEDILAQAPTARATEEVTHLVPEWAGALKGRKLYVQELTATARDAFEDSKTKTAIVNGRIKQEFDLDNIRARLVVRCLVDDQGAAVFTTAQVPLLGRCGSAPVDRLFDVCQRVCGMAKDEDLKNVPGVSPSTEQRPDAE